MKTIRELGMGLAVAGVLLAAVAVVATTLPVLDPTAAGFPPSLGLLSGAGGLAVWGLAHCDTLDGPVITLARKALETGNVNLVLPWVAAGDEPVIRAAFDRTLAVRGLGTAAREVADTHFFETLVRVHRAGEGESFTGLKPAGLDLGPAVPAADRALATGDVEQVVDLVRHAVEHGIRERFERARAARTFDPDDVPVGRAYVTAYVTYVHYVESLYAVAAGTAATHGHAAEAAPAHAVHEHAAQHATVAHAH